MELKNFVDFAYSMVNMDEVKSGKFILPKEVVFDLGKEDHIDVHKEIKEQKKEYNYENLNQEFDIEIFGMNFKFLENKAKQDIETLLKLTRKCYVSLSWGKQSTVLMHLVFSIDQNIPGVFWRGSETNILADYNDVIQTFLKKWKIKYSEEFCAANFKEQARDWSRKNKMEAVLMGLVKDESRQRRITLSMADENNIYQYANQEYYRCCPLRFWGDDIIAAYIAKYTLPVLNTYKKFGFGARTSARINLNGKSKTEKGLDFLNNDQLYKLKKIKGQKNGTL